MARDFDSAHRERLTGTNPVSGTPCTLACWFNVEKKPADPVNGSNIVLISIEQAGMASPVIRMRLKTTQFAASSMILVATQSDGVVGSHAETSNGLMSYGTWYHGCAVFSSDSSRTIYLDGANSDTDSTIQDPLSGENTMGIGFFDWSTARHHMEGMIAEAAVWNVGLTAAEVAILAKGVSPLLVRPEGLVFYLPMIRNEDRDIVGGIAMTPENFPTVGDHPPMIYPSPRPVFTPRKVVGPYCADVAGMFVPTTAAGEDYLTGAILGQSFSAGPVAGEVRC